MNNHAVQTKRLVILLVLAVAAFFRLSQLGDSPFRPDTMLFFDMCRRPVGAWAIFSQWLDLLGQTAQFPFSMAITKLFIDVFHLEPTAFVIRLPNAVFGVLTVLGMYMVGRQLAGRAFGLLLALFLAVNPFHIQLSREAYFYSAMLLGVTLQAWACLWAYRHRRLRGRFPLRFHAITLVGFFLMTYSHVSGWWVGWLFTLFLGWTLGIRAWRSGRARPDFWCWLAYTVLTGLPLLFVSWGLPFFIKDSLNPEKIAQSKRVMGGFQTPLISFVWQLLKSAAWGATPLRAGFLALTGALTMAGLVLSRRRFRRAWIMTLFLLGGFLVYCLSLFAAGSYYGQRHVAYLLPLYLVVLCYGIWHAGSFAFIRNAFRPPAWRRAPAYLLAGAAVALSIYPAWFSTQLTGKPAPYAQIAGWCDTNLPPRTLVLVERWLDPWNELRVHNSTNVIFTFTVPSEPPDVFTNLNWPATAKQFFANFPDAAYLEYKTSERSRMGVVTNAHFARSVAFTNEAGLKLAKLGVAYRDEFYDPATNLLVCTLFYNTREDVLQHAREQGRAFLVLYESSWNYIKLWQQLRDFRDWRILEDSAALDVYNLGLETNTVNLALRGMAVNGAKHVRIGTLSQASFQKNQLMEWRIEHVLLPPGLNKLVLRDARWASARIPLLVDQVRVLDETGARTPAAAGETGLHRAPAAPVK